VFASKRRVPSPSPISSALMLILALSLPACSSKTPSARPEGSLACEQLASLPPDVGTPLAIEYSNKIKLEGVTVKKRGPNQLTVRYYWSPLDTLGRYDIVFVHFTDSTGTILFQNDHSLCDPKLFKSAIGKHVLEECVVNTPPSLEGRTVSIHVGLYSSTSPNNERLPIVSSGTALIDDNGTRALVATLPLREF
jgi:hypothetical protein